MREIDNNAVMIAATMYALPPCLHIPIAARTIDSIQRFVGKVTPVYVKNERVLAARVQIVDPAIVDESLIIWDMPNSDILHRSPQVWVHVDHMAYRKAYALIDPTMDIAGKVIDHVRNRRVARIMGFEYVRVIPISRRANSSSGGLSEKWECEFQSLPSTKAWHLANPTQIQYADITDIAKMLDMSMENSLHDPVNVLQKRLREERK